MLPAVATGESPMLPTRPIFAMRTVLVTLLLLFGVAAWAQGQKAGSIVIEPSGDADAQMFKRVSIDHADVRDVLARLFGIVQASYHLAPEVDGKVTLEALDWWDYYFDPQRFGAIKTGSDWPKVGEAIKPLLGSKDRWIREAAEAVQKGFDAWLHPSRGEQSVFEVLRHRDRGKFRFANFPPS